MTIKWRKIMTIKQQFEDLKKRIDISKHVNIDLILDKFLIHQSAVGSINDPKVLFYEIPYIILQWKTEKYTSGITININDFKSELYVQNKNESFVITKNFNFLEDRAVGIDLFSFSNYINDNTLLEYKTEKMNHELETLEAVYVQDGDTMQNDDASQELTIKVENNNFESEKFYVIKTDRWAFDDVEELISLFNDFKNKLKHEKN